MRHRSRETESQKFPGQKISRDSLNPLEIPSIKRLTEWANSRVREYERNRPTMPTIKTYKVPGSSGNVYTITIRGSVVDCSCPGFTYRRRCKHILENSYMQDPKTP